MEVLRDDRRDEPEPADRQPAAVAGLGGINETYSCSEAELSAALNFSGRGFPALQTRALRKKVRDVEKVNGMYHLNGLLICRGMGLEYAPDGQAGRTAAVTLENVLTDDRKELALAWAARC